MEAFDFGMGMDCSNVRKVIQWGPPSGIESYVGDRMRRKRCKGCSCFTVLFQWQYQIEESVKNCCHNQANLTLIMEVDHKVVCAVTFVPQIVVTRANNTYCL